jgi:AAA domain
MGGRDPNEILRSDGEAALRAAVDATFAALSDREVTVRTETETSGYMSNGRLKMPTHDPYFGESELSRGVKEPDDFIFSAKLARDEPKREQAKTNRQEKGSTEPLTPAETPLPSKPVVFSNDWLSKPIQERRQVVQNRIYRCTTAILSGDGGLGKTNLALQLGVSVVRGFGWLNAVVGDRGPVLFYSAEEEDNEIQLRVGELPSIII